MTYQQAAKDRRIWECMGQELVLVRELIGEILCDAEYNSVMVNKTWDKWYSIIDRIDRIRDEADVRAYRYCPQFDINLFYGHRLDPARRLAEKIHRDMKE